MFQKILIANRGEIACRVAATARRLGVRTVAVYSDADAGAAHVQACDEAVPIGGLAAKDSYLQWQRILDAARATGAQAIHPGYGFLSENEDFARACAEAGLVFIGPPPEAIAAMGSKAAAKALMEQAGVPLVPGYHGRDNDPALLAAEAGRIGYPVLIKASAGGGGRGMRRVDRAEDFAEALASCQREARASFGDDHVLVERYVTRPRHIEIQLFADTQGNCVYLFERDCSVQRRHQKVLEEAPAPGMSEQRRKAMGDAAVAAARAVGYVGAGTVEFIAQQDGTFYFMEMNTRLQVEHPVTEMITGTDLVEWQLRVAAGEPLPLLQDALTIRGHAIEARVYAENPDKGFLPSIGTLRHLRTPAAAEFTREAAVRIDAGVREGDAITPYYDPMIAKLIVWGEDRAQALARMAQALAGFEVVGLSTNVDFLGRLIASAPFAGADLDTGLIDRHQATLFPAAQHAPLPALALTVAALLLDERQSSADPWADPSGWRMNALLERTMTFDEAAGESMVRLVYARDGVRVRSEQGEALLSAMKRDGRRISVRVDGQLTEASVVRENDSFHVFHAGRHWQLDWRDAIAHAGEQESEGGRLTAPMPGKIVALLVEAGAQVDKGAPLLIMEAMKMEHTISAPSKGKVAELLYAVGDQVAEGAQLLSFGTEFDTE